MPTSASLRAITRPPHQAHPRQSTVHASPRTEAPFVVVLYSCHPNMTLAPGARLGPYEIVAVLGAGGPASARGAAMGELRRGHAEANERTR